MRILSMCKGIQVTKELMKVEIVVDADTKHVQRDTSTARASSSSKPQESTIEP